MTETSILRITLSNQFGDNRNINLDNPKNGITLQQVQTAAAPLLSDTFLAGTEYLTNVRRARKIVTSTTDIE